MNAALNQMTRLWFRSCQALGGTIVGQVNNFLEMYSLFYATMIRLFRFPWRVGEINKSIVQIGIGSLPIITIATAFAGVVITNEMAYHMDLALHSVTMIPGVTRQFILRELGIVIPALLMVAKVGASITAEIGSMKVTEQIDALRLLGIDPVSYLVFPRFVASIISTVCMTMFAIGITVLCAVAVATTQLGFGAGEYLNILRQYVAADDIALALAKAVVFGSIIPIVSCSY